jgi:hypothetical protein
MVIYKAKQILFGTKENKKTIEQHICNNWNTSEMETETNRNNSQIVEEK